MGFLFGLHGGDSCSRVDDGGDGVGCRV